MPTGPVDIYEVKRSERHLSLSKTTDLELLFGTVTKWRFIKEDVLIKHESKATLHDSTISPMGDAEYVTDLLFFIVSGCFRLKVTVTTKNMIRNPKKS